MPRFARLEVDPDQAFPLRAKIVRAGPLYLTHDAPAASPGEGHGVLLKVIALDGDAGGTPRRPRLLCEGVSARVAAYMDAADLGTVALAGAVLVPGGSPAATAPDAPGVHFAAGALIELLPPPGDRAPVHFHGRFLDARGVVPRDHLDVVYTPDPAVNPVGINADLLRDVALRVRPNGPTFGRIAKDSKDSTSIIVQRLAGPSHGFVEIRYDENDAYAIGWVPSNAVRLDDDPTSSGHGSGHGSGLGGTERVRLARGTLLADPATGAIVGVVTADAAFECRADCASPAPRIAVEACAGTVELRARRAR